MGNRGPVFFEEWAFLARVDSVLFERRRQEAIADLLNSATSDQQKIAGAALQREIDRTIEQSSDPAMALMQIARMMQAQLEHLLETLTFTRANLSALQQILEPDQPSYPDSNLKLLPESSACDKRGKP